MHTEIVGPMYPRRLLTIGAALTGSMLGIGILIITIFLTAPTNHSYAASHWRTESGLITKVDTIWNNTSAPATEAIWAEVSLKSYYGRYIVAHNVELPVTDKVGSREPVTVSSDGQYSFINILDGMGYEGPTNDSTVVYTLCGVFGGIILGILGGWLSFIGYRRWYYYWAIIRKGDWFEWGRELHGTIVE